jgi:hypothetical protein
MSDVKGATKPYTLEKKKSVVIHHKDAKSAEDFNGELRDVPVR